MNVTTSFGDRLKLCLAAATGGSQAPLAKFLASKQGTSEQSGRSRVSNWMKSPDAEPLASTLALVVEFLHLHGLLVRAEWLAGGSGPMTLDNPASDVLKIHGQARRIPVLTADTVVNLESALGNREQLRAAVADCLNKNKGVDVFLEVSASAFAVVVSGDSMAPTLVAGDLVVIDPEAERQPGRVMLAIHRDTHLLRRLQDDGAGWLASDNLRYPLIPLAEATLVGPVVQLHRSTI
jgi:phage repressor protein C with HTH and peptisase S24 domain